MKDSDGWIGLTGENFKIRGPNYLKDHKKIMSEECVFKMRCCELVNSKNRTDNFSSRPESLVQKLRAQGYKGEFYVYNIMVSVVERVEVQVKYKGNYVCLLAYFEIPENLEVLSPHVATLWKRYLEGDEKYRNDRLKMIARCPSISFVWELRGLNGTDRG